MSNLTNVFTELEPNTVLSVELFGDGSSTLNLIPNADKSPDEYTLVGFTKGFLEAEGSMYAGIIRVGSLTFENMGYDSGKDRFIGRLKS